MIRKTIIYLSILFPLCTMAQDNEIYSTGLVDDHEVIARMPMKKELLTRSYSNDALPPSYSLQQYCPRAGSQSNNGQSAYATCTAWATVYAAMTIMEAVRWGWTDRDIITHEAFSPLFVYSKIKFKGDDNCNLGIGLYTTLPFLCNVGAPKHRNYIEYCNESVPRWVADEAADHKVSDFVKLFDEPSFPGTDAEKVRITKKSIAEKKPVIIGMFTPQSFQSAGEVWLGGMAEGEKLTKNPDHCMCVVGYDDNKADGAFLVMNSWGERWGKDGFTWIRYDDYIRFVGYAFEIYSDNEKRPVKIQSTPVLQQPNPVQQPTPVQEQQENATPSIVVDDLTERPLAGSMYVQLKTGETPSVRRTEKSPCPVYHVEGKFIHGTRFRIYLSNTAPAYVYMIGTDDKNKVDAVFPPEAGISPLLTSANDTIALPGNDWWAEMDNNSRNNNLCILYANHALPMDRIMDYIREHDGDIEDKLARAVDTLCPGERVPAEEIDCERSRIDFSSISTANIVPLVVEIIKKKD